jgi:nucleoside-diphosphate-sugar epimerase
MIVWVTKNLAVASCNDVIESGVSVLDVRHLVDKKGNDPQILRNEIGAGAKMLKEGNKIVVCCDLGVSRSVAVAAGILSLSGKSFDKSLELILRKVHNQSLNLDLVEDIGNSIGFHRKTVLKKRKKMTILIISSEEFIGGKLVDLLAKDYTVYSLKEADVDLQRGALPIYSEIQKKKVDVIVDLLYPEPQNLINLLPQSVTATRNIMEACRLNKTPLIFLSTLHVFDGYKDKDLPVLESDVEPRPMSLYGQSRALCEQIIRWYRQLYKMDITILRIPNVYGENMEKTSFLFKLILSAVENKPITIHRYLNGFQRLDFLDIRDLSTAVERSIRFVPSEDINLGSRDQLSTLALARLVTKLANSKSAINIVNVKDDRRDLVADTKKTCKLLRMQAQGNLADGVKKIIKKHMKGRIIQ